MSGLVAADADDGVYPLRSLGEVDEKLQDVDRTLRVTHEHERDIRLYQPRIQVIGDLARIVNGARASSDDNRGDANTAVAEAVQRAAERPGLLPETLAECARYQEHLHRRSRMRAPRSGPGGFVLEAVQPEITGHRRAAVFGIVPERLAEERTKRGPPIDDTGRGPGVQVR